MRTRSTGSPRHDARKGPDPLQPLSWSGACLKEQAACEASAPAATGPATTGDPGSSGDFSPRSGGIAIVAGVGLGVDRHHRPLPPPEGRGCDPVGPAGVLPLGRRRCALLQPGPAADGRARPPTAPRAPGPARRVDRGHTPPDRPHHDRDRESSPTRSDRRGRRRDRRRLGRRCRLERMATASARKRLPMGAPRHRRLVRRDHLDERGAPAEPARAVRFVRGTHPHRRSRRPHLGPGRELYLRGAPHALQSGGGVDRARDRVRTDPDLRVRRGQARALGFHPVGPPLPQRLRHLRKPQPSGGVYRHRPAPRGGDSGPGASYLGARRAVGLGRRRRSRAPAADGSPRRLVGCLRRRVDPWCGPPPPHSGQRPHRGPRDRGGTGGRRRPSRRRQPVPRSQGGGAVPIRVGQLRLATLRVLVGGHSQRGTSPSRRHRTRHLRSDLHPLSGRGVGQDTRIRALRERCAQHLLFVAVQRGGAGPPAPHCSRRTGHRLRGARVAVRQDERGRP